MACDEMREWEEVEEQVEELIALDLPATPSKEDLMEEIHEESHRLIDLQVMLVGKPHLKKGEMASLLKEAAGRVIARYRGGCKEVAPDGAAVALAAKRLGAFR